MWQGLARALGHEELLSDPRFTTNKERLANKHALWPILEEAFRTRNARMSGLPFWSARKFPSASSTRSTA